VLEDERPLRPRVREAREAAGEPRRAVRVDEARDAPELVVGDLRVPAADRSLELRALRRRRRSERDELEEAMDGVPDLRGREGARRCRPADGFPSRQSQDAFRVEAVRAALEECERAVREAPDVVNRGRRDLGERGQLDAQARTSGGHLVEELELELRVVERLDDDRLLATLLSVMPGDREHEARILAVELDGRAVRFDHGVVRVEPIQHPADRRRTVRRPLGIDRAGDDQPVDRAGHRDVVEAEPLLPLLIAGRHTHGVPVEHAATVTTRRVHHSEAEAAVRERDDLVRAARPPDVATRVGDDDHLELEALGRVDREEPDRAAPFLLRDRLELLRPERILVAHKPHEAFDVRPADRLVLARHPAELAEVGEAARPVPACEHREVVVVLADDSVTQRLETVPRGRAHQTLVALDEGTEQAVVTRVELPGEPSFERGEQRPAYRVTPEQNERVVRDAHERRRQDRGQRDVVVPVVQEAQVGEEVDDLLLPEVPAPRRTKGRQPLPPKRLFVPLRVRACGEEHDDLARIGLAGVDELPHATRDAPRLARAPMLGRLREARLVRDEELDRMTEHRIGKLGRRSERLVVVTEGVAEEVVHRREHLRARAVVVCQREQARRLCAPLAEDLEVCVPKAVDGLELISDGEDLREIGMRDEVDELALEPIRVLELVHHDHAEPQLGRLADRGVVAQEVARRKLEVLEVDGRLTSLRGRVLGGEPLEELLQQVAVVRGKLLERSELRVLARRLERRRPRTARRERGQVDELLGPGPDRRNAQRLPCVPALGLGRRRVGRE
jgi:hypothetical protein